MVVRASLFGVGAPEALVIRVVALLVFSPKGLGEVARNLGKTLRDFQPAIKEPQEVSREFKSTLEKAIGLDEISSELQSTYNSNKGSAIPTPSSTVKTENSPITPDPSESLEIIKICFIFDMCLVAEPLICLLFISNSVFLGRLLNL
ncbi:hypothetical protein K2173_023146 [Erythroxylum novogranatense]|uniref:Sec-independent protein translocase protein TatA n=1 Tax=Erythroxylum novogranatense TaxID=1862640 RepID=A0AAV8U910_9ROSI|nr:hypothetical protein K2173_023146 [Erythroxylum novogranatense]